MKKLILTAIAIVAMVSTLASIGVAAPINHDDDIVAMIEKAKPHTEEYIATKKIIDKFEQDVKKATSCEDLNAAEEELFSAILMLVFVEEEFEESEKMTEEESDELDAQMNSANEMKEKKAEQFGCEPETDDDAELIPTSTEEWEEIIAEYEIVLSKLEKLAKQKLSPEENLTHFFQIIQEHNELIERMDKSDESNLTEKQERRLTEINDRIAELANEMGLSDDFDE